MTTYTQIIYQIIFATRQRSHVLTKGNREELFKYITGVSQNNKCHVLQIGGVTDHIHILTDLHPTIALADLIKDIKLSTSELIKEKKLFKHFNGWQEGYGAFTYSKREKETLVNYIKNQEAHHHKKTSEQELLELLEYHEVAFDEKYFL